MAANWWKYGLCVFGGLGIGYAVGVKITRNKAEEEMEQKISDIREIYRNDRRSAKPEKPKKEEKEPEKPEIQTKTSIDIQRLSQKKERAEEAANKYSKAFKPETKPGTEEEVTRTASRKNRRGTGATTSISSMSSPKTSILRIGMKY